MRPLEIAKKVCSLGEENNRRPQPIEAASKFIEDHFPKCNAALLAGSVIRGEATETSDLDIIVFDEKDCIAVPGIASRTRLAYRVIRL